MKKSSNILIGALVGLMLTAPLIVVFFLGDRILGLPLIPFDIFAWLTRVLPGPVVTFGIDTMVDSLILLGFNVAATAKTAEHIMAVANVLVTGVVVVTAFFALIGRITSRPRDWLGLVVGLLVGVPAAVISISVAITPVLPPAVGGLWAVVLFAIWGMAIPRTYNALVAPGVKPQAEQAMSVEQLNRRDFLIKLGGATAAITVVGVGLDLALKARDSQPAQTATGAGEPAAPAATGTPVRAGDSSQSYEAVDPAPGTRSEITPVEDHYLIDINPRPPAIEEATWRLSIFGLVDNPVELTLDEIKSNYAPIDRYITLSCISNRVGGNLIGTTRWTGASLQEILADTGVQAGATHIEIKSIDGFHETVALDLINEDSRIMLTYAWDGEPLTRDHGFPLRIWIPNRYGMKQPRWIETIEVTNEDRPGYWVTRGWDKAAVVKTTSVIDTVADPYEGESGQMLVPIGGIAYAGARGISQVEVRTDDGEWQKTQLIEPLSDTTWVLWRYDWPFEAGKHTFEVRCLEDDSTPQITEVADPRPSGATGLHSVRADL